MTEHRHDDGPAADAAFWEAALARLDGSERTGTTLERALEEAPDVPLRPFEVEGIVARVTGADRAARTRRRTWTRIAAVAIGAILAAAAGRLIWPEKRDSHRTMDFTQMIELLGRPGAALEDRAAALSNTRGRIEYGLRTLREIRGDTDAPAALRDRAARALVALVALFGDPGRSASSTAPTDEVLEQAGTTARDPRLPEETRAAAVDVLGAATAVGVAAVRDAAGLHSDLAAEIARVQRAVADELAR